MKSGDMAALITSIAALVAAVTSLGGLLISLRNLKKIEIVHKATNSMKDELVSEVRAAALAKGKLDGIAQEKGKTP